MNDETDDNVLASITFADLLPEETHRSFTLKQSLEWANRNCHAEAVRRLKSRAVVARLVEEVNKLQALLAEVDNDLTQGFYLSHRVSFRIDDYFSELNEA